MGSHHPPTRANALQRTAPGVTACAPAASLRSPRERKPSASPVSSIIYRRMEPSETATVSMLAREVFDQFVASGYSPEGITEFHRYASHEALSQRHDSGYVTFVAERSGEIVGMLHLCEPCHVSMLFVRAAHQRSGVGRGLLASAGEADCPFTVNSSPNAIAAYERLGFRVTGSEQCLHGIRFVPMLRLSPNDRHS